MDSTYGKEDLPHLVICFRSFKGKRLIVQDEKGVCACVSFPLQNGILLFSLSLFSSTAQQKEQGLWHRVSEFQLQLTVTPWVSDCTWWASISPIVSSMDFDIRLLGLEIQLQHSLAWPWTSYLPMCLSFFISKVGVTYFIVIVKIKWQNACIILIVMPVRNKLFNN